MKEYCPYTCGWPSRSREITEERERKVKINGKTESYG